MIKLKSYAGKTDQGPYLNVNEDGQKINLKEKLFLIMDGYGGSGIGDKAVSELAVNIEHCYLHIGGSPDATLPFFYNPRYLIEGNALVNSFLFSHAKLLEQNKKKPIGERAGASAIACAFSENLVSLVSTGNCRSYLLRQGKLTKISHDDSFSNLSSDNYMKELKTIPMSGFGLFDQLVFNSTEIRTNEDDTIIMMTDGVYARLIEDEVSHILSVHRQSLTETIDKLFDLANTRGNQDNQTAIILQF